MTEKQIETYRNYLKQEQASHELRAKSEIDYYRAQDSTTKAASYAHALAIFDSVCAGRMV
jgi:hypothetical protein